MLHILRRRGARRLVSDAAWLIAGYARQRTCARDETFRFAGDTYHYCTRLYNATWNNERAVEIPIALRMVNDTGAGPILEIGNVLGHYTTHRHTVVDKYEQSPGIVNADALTYRSSERYDLIVSISTLEHVGWDEPERDPHKVLAVVDNMRSLLALGGHLLVTLPMGYNPPLDHLIASGMLHFDEAHYLRRRSRWTMWEEISASAAAGAAFNTPYPAGNVVLVGIIRNC